jgi:hypothetical protein
VKYLQKATPISKVAEQDSEVNPASSAKIKGRRSFRRRQFVAEYVKDFNATQAAIKAGYSVDIATFQGQRLMTFPAVRKAIAQALSNLFKKSRVSIEWCREELIRVADFNPRDCFDRNDTVLPINRIPESARRGLTRFNFEVLFDFEKRRKTDVRRLTRSVPLSEQRWTG